MAGFSARIVQDWYRGKVWLWILAPLALVFYLLTGMRRVLYHLQWKRTQRVAVPVIVVGNIAVGGTGKTPLVAALVDRLVVAGFRPGIASRGYGGKPPFTPFSVTVATDAGVCGDEPLLLARRTGVPVVIDSDRVAACEHLVAQHRCDVIVTDDGLQHYRLHRDIEIVVIDGERGLGNACLLPMGPLRELPRRLNKVDHVVINGDGAAPGSGLADKMPTTMHIQPGSWVNLKSLQTLPVDSWPLDKQVHAVAGIGNPSRFFNVLRGLGFAITEHAFDDHHVFKSGDLQFDDNLPVVMTEKDAVKCLSQIPHDQCWYLSIDAVLPDSFYDDILGQLQQCLHTQE